MNIRNWFRRRRTGDDIAAWAAEIARRCHCEVVVRLGQTMYRMSLPQARGYIRARAAAAIDQEIALLVRQRKCQPALLLALREQASEHVVRMAIGDLLQLSRKRHRCARRRSTTDIGNVRIVVRQVRPIIGNRGRSLAVFSPDIWMPPCIPR